MPVFYMDTSALAKHYKREKGSEVVDVLFSGRQTDARLVLSFLSAIEFASMVTRLQRGGLLDQDEAVVVVSRFSEDCRSLDIAPLTHSILEDAVVVARRGGLRTLDAIHLAAADLRRVSLAAGVMLVAISADREVCDAAQSEGIEILNPEGDDAMQRLREIRSGRG